MKYAWIDEYLMKKRCVTRDLQADWNRIRYNVSGKMFASVLLDQSLELVLRSFSKARQREILGLACCLCDKPYTGE